MLKAKSVKRDSLIKFGTFQFNEYTLTVLEFRNVNTLGNSMFGINFFKVHVENRFINKEVVRSLFGFDFSNRCRNGQYDIQVLFLNVCFFEKRWSW